MKYELKSILIVLFITQAVLCLAYYAYTHKYTPRPSKSLVELNQRKVNLAKIVVEIWRTLENEDSGIVNSSFETQDRLNSSLTKIKNGNMYEFYCENGEIFLREKRNNDNGEYWFFSFSDKTIRKSNSRDLGNPGTGNPEIKGNQGTV